MNGMKGLNVKISALVVSAYWLAATAQAPSPRPAADEAEADAQALVDAVLGESVQGMLAKEHEDLAGWAQTVIDRSADARSQTAMRPLVPGGPTGAGGGARVSRANAGEYGGSPRLHEPVGAGAELAAMEPGSGTDRRPDAAARRGRRLG